MNESVEHAGGRAWVLRCHICHEYIKTIEAARRPHWIKHGELADCVLSLAQRVEMLEKNAIH